MVSSFRNLSSYLPCRRRGACYGKIFRGKGRGLARVVPSFLRACRALRWITSDGGQPSTGRAQQPRLRAVGFHLIKAKWKDRRSVEAVPIWLRRRAQDSFEAPLQLTARKGECWEMRSLRVITAPRQGWDPQRAPPCQPCPPHHRQGSLGAWASHGQGAEAGAPGRGAAQSLPSSYNQGREGVRTPQRGFSPTNTLLAHRSSSTETPAPAGSSPRGADPRGAHVSARSLWARELAGSCW